MTYGVLLNKPKKCVTKAFIGLLPHLLPKRGRRAIFLTTLYMEIANLSTVHRDMLNELNSRLNIVNDISALELPTRLHDTIWRVAHANFHINPNLEKDGDFVGICKRIVDEFPEWGNYGDKEKVMEETRKVMLMAYELRDNFKKSDYEFYSKLEEFVKKNKSSLDDAHPV